FHELPALTVATSMHAGGLYQYNPYVTIHLLAETHVYGATHQHDGACAEEERKNHKRCVRPHQVSIRLTPVWIANSAPVSARGQSTKSADLSLQADESLGCFSWRL